MATSKTQRIDLWRHEVALASSASSDNAAAADGAETTTPLQQKRRSRTSFLSKLLRPKSNEISVRDEAFGTTAMYRTVPVAGAGCEARASGRHGDGKDRDPDGGNGESMAIADVSVSSSGPEGGLAVKQKRLERAARLLGKGRVKDGL